MYTGCFFKIWNWFTSSAPVSGPLLKWDEQTGERRFASFLSFFFFSGTRPVIIAAVSMEVCARLLYLRLQPWFSLPAALPEPANDRISLTYPVTAVSFFLSLPLSLAASRYLPLSCSLSLSRSLSVLHTPFSFAEQAPLFHEVPFDSTYRQSHAKLARTYTL